MDSGYHSSVKRILWALAALVILTGSAAAQGFSILTSSPLPNGTTGVAYETSGLQFTVSTTAPTTWSLFSGSLPGGLTLNASGLLSGTPTLAGSYTFTVQATAPSAGPPATKSFSLTVLDPIVVSPSTIPTGYINFPYSVQFTASGGGGGPYTFFTEEPLPPGLTLDSSGLLAGTPTLANSFTFTVVAEEANLNAGTKTYTLVISNTAPLQFTGSCPTSSLPLGQPINISAQATGGTSPYTYFAPSPAWVSYSVAGAAFTGTPPGAGTYNLAARVADSVGGAATFSCSFTVASALGVSGSCPTGSMQGSPITPFNLTGSGGGGSYSWTVLNPSWLNLGVAEGAFASFNGTPTSSGIIPVSIRLSDTIGSTATTFSCNLAVAAPLTLNSTCNTTYPLTAISFPISASGGFSPYSFSNSSLAWLTYNASAGALTGTPPASGNYSTTFEVVDNNGNRATRACSFAVASAMSVSGSCPTSAYSGSAITPFTLTVAGGSGPYTWNVVSPSWLSLSNSSGNTATFGGTPPAAGSYSVSITVDDAVGSTRQTYTCTIVVSTGVSLNGSCPATSVPLNGTVSIPVTAAGGSGGYTYQTISPAWLTYNATAGAFTGTPPAAGTYSVQLQVTDSGGRTATFNCSVTVAAALSASGSCPASAVLGSPISSFTVTAAGGGSPYSWTVLSPAWLTPASTTGTSPSFGGTPTSTGNASVSIRLTDSIGSTATSFTCTIPVSSSLSLSGTCPTTTVPLNGTVSIPVTASGGTGGYTYQTLSPAWLTYNASAGAFTGTPPAAGTYSVQLQVTDSSGSRATFNCSVTVAAALSASGSCPASAVVGTSITPFTLTAAGGAGPYSWTVLSPSWLTPASTAGNTPQFSGTPTASGNASVSIRLTDNIGSTAGSFTCTIPVSAALSLTGTCPTSTIPVNGTVTIPVSASGGTGGYTFTAISPAWLSYNAASGAFTGTPPGAGTYSVSLRVTDSSGAQATFNCSVTVGSGLTATGTCPSSATVGTAIAPFTLTASGGQPPYNWTVSSPAWLSLGSASGPTAQFSGTPTAAGNAAVLIQITDAINSPAGSFSCTIPVNAALSLTGTCPTTTVPLNGTVSIPVAASGGSGGYTFTAVSPAWLSYNAASGAFTGNPPAAGTYPVQLRVTDSSGAQANFNCSVTVGAALSATGTCPASATAGTAITPFVLTGSGGQTPYSWTVVSPAWLTQGAATATTSQFSGTPTAAGNAAVSIRLSDAIGTTAATFTCTIPVNAGLSLTGTCPTATVPVNGTVTIPVTASGGSGGYTFTAVSPAWLSYNAASGAFTGTPPAAGTYPIQLRVTDSAGNTANFNCSVTVGAALSATGTCPTSATNGVAITPFTLTASGGQGPYTWAISSPGWLRQGTTTATTSQFTGTPTASGNAVVSVRLTDSISTPATSFTCTIPVNAALTLTGTCPTSTVPVNGTVTIPVTASGGSGGYTFTAVSPAWLSYNASLGAFTGTAPAAGTYPIQLRVTDSSGNTANFNCSITVGAAMTINGTCPTTPVVGTALTFSLSVQGGVGPYTWAVVSPSWLQVTANGTATATFSGTPTTGGAVDFNITVTDSIQTPLARFTCRAVVQGKLNITTSCPTKPYPTGTRLDLPVQATGGTGVYTFKVNSPTWLAYQTSTSSVAGTPPAAGVFPFSITLSDSSGAQSTFTCNLNVATQLTLSGPCPTTAPSDSQFTFSVTASGGTAPYTFSVLSPTWLQLRGVQGNIANFGGQPLAGGADITILASDASQWATPFNCHVNFSGPPPTPPLRVSASCPAESFPAGVRVEIPIQLTGGNGENTFRSISPSWLTYDPGAGKLTGVPPAPGTYTVSATAADGTGVQSSFGCGITVAPRLVATGLCQETVTTGSNLDINVSVQGGTPPYNWSVVSPTWLQVKSTAGNTATLTGTAPAAGPVDVQVKVADAIQSLPATFACGVKVNYPALKVETSTPPTTPGSPQSGSGCPTAPVPAGQRLTLPYSVSGGSGTGYRWTLGPAPSWMRLTNTTGTETSIIGEAPGDGVAYTVGITVTDDSGNTFQPPTCSFRTLETLKLQGTPPGNLVVGAPFVIQFTGSGGTGPYQWTFSGPPWLSLSATSGTTVTLEGTPPNNQAFTCTVSFQDSVGSKSQSFDCSGKATLPPLSVNIVSSACPAEPLVFGQSFSGQLQAVGGDKTYTWNISGPSWLKSSPTGEFLSLSGSPDLIQDYTYSVDVADGSGTAPARYSCTLRVVPPGIPRFSMVLAPPTNILEPVAVTLELSFPAPIDLIGEAELTFTSGAFGSTDNPQVQWIEPPGQRRRFTFRIPAGTRTLVLGRFQPGTVAGTITITLTGLQGGGISVLSDRSSGQVSVPAQPPVLTQLSFDNETANGFTIVITGYSTPRSLVGATVTFNPRPGTQLTGSSGFTIDLAETARAYYQTAESLEGGSTFVLRFPVTITGNKGDIGSVTVVFTNSAGQSTPITKDR